MRNSWADEYWLLAMQLYLRKPVGVKPAYSRAAVAVASELHVLPETLHRKLLALAAVETPRLARLHARYAEAPQRLARAVKLLRRMTGFGRADDFYDGVDREETFERDFRPLPEDAALTPAALLLVLDLYFRLTPLTMRADTPEVAELAASLRVPAKKVADVMEVFQFCDPLLCRDDVMIHPLLLPCRQIWDRFAPLGAEKISRVAAEWSAFYQ